jgi:hypothetical protein
VASGDDGGAQPSVPRMIFATVVVILTVVIVWAVIEYRMQPPPPPNPAAPSVQPTR